MHHWEGCSYSNDVVYDENPFSISKLLTAQPAINSSLLTLNNFKFNIPCFC